MALEFCLGCGVPVETAGGIQYGNSQGGRKIIRTPDGRAHTIVPRVESKESEVSLESSSKESEVLLESSESPRDDSASNEL